MTKNQASNLIYDARDHIKAAYDKLHDVAYEPNDFTEEDKKELRHDLMSVIYELRVHLAVVIEDIIY